MDWNKRYPDASSHPRFRLPTLCSYFPGRIYTAITFLFMTRKLRGCVWLVEYQHASEERVTQALMSCRCWHVCVDSSVSISCGMLCWTPKGMADCRGILVLQHFSQSSTSPVAFTVLIDYRCVHQSHLDQMWWRKVDLFIYFWWRFIECHMLWGIPLDRSTWAEQHQWKVNG